MTPLNAAPYDFERRRRCGRVIGFADWFKDQADAQSVVDQGENVTGNAFALGSRVSLDAAGIGVVPADVNGLASVWEYFNTDPFTDLSVPVTANGRGDAIFGNPMYLSALVAPARQFGIVSTIRVGIGIGSPWNTVSASGVTAGAAEVDTAIHMSLRYDPSTTQWSIVVVDKFSAVGHRRFTKVLGTTAALGLNTLIMGIAVGCHLELRYLPNQAVIAYVDGAEIGRFTDADAGADTPLLSIWNNRRAIGATIKGPGAFVFLGSAATTTTQYCLSIFDFYREMFGAY